MGRFVRFVVVPNDRNTKSTKKHKRKQKHQSAKERKLSIFSTQNIVDPTPRFVNAVITVWALLPTEHRKKVACILDPCIQSMILPSSEQVMDLKSFEENVANTLAKASVIRVKAI